MAPVLDAGWEALVVPGDELCSKEQTGFRSTHSVAIPRQIARLQIWYAGGWAAGSMRAGPWVQY